MAQFDLNDDSLVVIVGSGAGGGTLGNELAQKGVNVVILEAGDRHEILMKPMRPSEFVAAVHRLIRTGGRVGPPGRAVPNAGSGMPISW